MYNVYPDPTGSKTLLYTSNLINQPIFAVGGKKKGRAGAVRKRLAGLSSARAQGASTLFLFSNLLLPTT
ncbi:hypothetical protein HMPREF0083_04381 [Aneurinibacillus aneurinilyticus ATCC 12856]|uniref:Uncharacterized protein n=1 Tax=Aneurinibacillus aneurinilyticus ATCC 12856 TaxID=649747 RepID=U1WG32_ANEAE|nr:hypothetical protein HMPREF0083_04381 [Aneurinibacillus aneurinilyticus ATCC 12856]